MRDAVVAELNRILKPAQPAAPADGSAAALVQAQDRVAELEKKLALAQMATVKMPETVAELMAMKRVAEEVRKEERAARKEARRAQAPAPEAGETIETLAEKLRQAQQQLKGRQTRVRKLEDWVRKHAAGKAILMSKGLYRQIHKALHPDLANSDAKENRRLTELAQEFNNYEIEHSDA